MQRNRSALIGAGVGLALGMPLFEVFLLTTLAIDGELFNAAHTIQYFSHSANLIILLLVLHTVTAAIGAAVGYLVGRVRKRRRLRVIPGMAGRGA
jgi:membrane protein DedA with SNARE-associated domain